MRRRILLLIIDLLIIALGVIVYLVLLPVHIQSTSAGLQITFPPLFRAAGRAGGDPMNWNYVLLLPITFLIIAVGLEITHLFQRRKYR